jgi:AraC-like DNA-binding protein
MVLSQPSREWVDFRRVHDLNDLELLHARFVSHQFRPHSHAEYVLASIEAGVEVFRCGGKYHAAVAGQIMLFHPDEVHTGAAGDTQGWLYRALYIPPVMFSRLVGALPIFKSPIIDDPVLAQTVLQVCASLGQVGSTLERSSLVTGLLGALVQRHALERKAEALEVQECSAVRRIRDLLQEMPERNWTLETLAMLVGLRPLTLLRSFRTKVGLTPHEFQTQCRVRQAKQALRSGAGISEVALEVGFCDQSHLNRHFKRLVGVSPGQYRKS